MSVADNVKFPGLESLDAGWNTLGSEAGKSESGSQLASKTDSAENKASAENKGKAADKANNKASAETKLKADKKAKYPVGKFRENEIELRKRMTAALKIFRDKLDSGAEKASASDHIAFLGSYLESLQKLDQEIKASSLGKEDKTFDDPRFVQIMTYLVAEKLDKNDYIKKTLNKKGNEPKVKGIFDKVVGIHEQIFDFEFDDEIEDVFNRWNSQKEGTMDISSVRRDQQRFEAILLGNSNEKLVNYVILEGQCSVEPIDINKLATRHQKELSEFKKVKEDRDIVKITPEILQTINSESTAKKEIELLKLQNEDVRQKLIESAQKEGSEEEGTAYSDVLSLIQGIEGFITSLSSTAKGEELPEVINAKKQLAIAKEAAEAIKKNAEEAETNYDLALDALNKRDYLLARNIINRLRLTPSEKRAQAEQAYKNVLQSVFKTIEKDVPELNTMSDTLNKEVADKAAADPIVKLVASKLLDKAEANGDAEKQSKMQEKISHVKENGEASLGRIKETKEEIASNDKGYKDQPSERIRSMLQLVQVNNIDESLVDVLASHGKFSEAVNALTKFPASGEKVNPGSTVLSDAAILSASTDDENATKPVSKKLLKENDPLAKQSKQLADQALLLKQKQAEKSQLHPKPKSEKAPTSVSTSAKDKAQTQEKSANSKVDPSVASGASAIPGAASGSKAKKPVKQEAKAVKTPTPVLLSKEGKAGSAASNEAKEMTDKKLAQARMEEIKAEQLRLRQQAASKQKSSAGKK